MIEGLISNATASNYQEPKSGIFITKIVQPEQGAIVLWHCKYCKSTEIMVSKWAIKPDKGEAWRIEQPCPDHALLDLPYFKEPFDYKKANEFDTRYIPKGFVQPL